MARTRTRTRTRKTKSNEIIGLVALAVAGAAITLSLTKPAGEEKVVNTYTGVPSPGNLPALTFPSFPTYNITSPLQGFTYPNPFTPSSLPENTTPQNTPLLTTFTSINPNESSPSPDLVGEITNTVNENLSFLGGINSLFGIAKDIFVESGYEGAKTGTEKVIQTFPSSTHPTASAAGAATATAIPTSIIYGVAKLATSGATTAIGKTARGAAGALFLPIAGYEAFQAAGAFQAYSEQLTRTQSPFDAGNLAVSATTPIATVGLLPAIPTNPLGLVATSAAGLFLGGISYGTGFAVQVGKNAINPNVPLMGRPAEPERGDSFGTPDMKAGDLEANTEQNISTVVQSDGSYTVNNSGGKVKNYTTYVKAPKAAQGYSKAKAIRLGLI